MSDPNGPRSREDRRSCHWRRLAHRWFVQYNPLYLISAAMVLVGVFLLSDGLARSGSGLADLWIPAITELYQFLLIAGATLLYRMGQRRPAVMLALLEVVYICDLTFQTEVVSFWGITGLHPVSVLLVASLLLSTRWIHSERRVWMAVLGAMTLCVLANPGFVSSAAIMSSIILALRAWRGPALARRTPAGDSLVLTSPYRTSGLPLKEAPLSTAAEEPPSPGRPEALRLYVGSLAGIYLSLWTLTWQGDPWPGHCLWLDLIFTLHPAIAGGYDSISPLFVGSKRYRWEQGCYQVAS